MSNTTTTKTVTWGHGQNTIYAGTPLDTNGTPVMDNTAVGIVAEDLHAPDRTATIITAGEWDESVNEARFHIADVVKTTLSNITFSNPPVNWIDSAELATALAGYVQKTQLATAEAAGVVKMGESVADAEDAPTMAEFNGLLGSLRTAGIIEPLPEPEPDPDPEVPAENETT